MTIDTRHACMPEAGVQEGWCFDRETRYPNPTEGEKAMKSLDDHIEITPGICSGKPRIAGRRITVAHIAIWHERLGKCADEIATEYDLTLADVYAALAYYFDHREEIDQSIKEGEEFAEALRQKTPSRLGFMSGQIKVPDDFDSMGSSET